MTKKTKQFIKRARDAKNGQFIPIAKAKRRPTTTVIEKTPLPSSKKKEKK